MEPNTLLTIVHLFGAVMGAGGAFMSDLMFFKSVKDEQISKTEMGFLQLGSTAVWIGILILVTSGAGLFLLDMHTYTASSKFLAKISIVGIIIINGIVFHTAHIPRLLRHTESHLPSSDEFMQKRGFLLASGAISTVSWSAALILGALRSVPYSYFVIMSVYLVCVVSAAAGAILLKGYIFLPHKKNP